ncbi:stage VI sporulation protein D [Shouchella tritolerans]|uniref:stage VI sporulation protein D n=1 Tax=Shouchella tritolerans TaxID=2979466 RepID=UPI0021E82B2F|nr:stage VI sporulation protein D [Shouchella tritolerans]
MAQEQSSTLTFSIEDSVWLNQGQQIDEILGMTLTPEIFVDQDGEHVTIKGGLRFVGEYKIDRGVEEEKRIDDGESFADLSDFRQSGQLVEHEGEIGEIEHLFPIDITIPMARIQHIDDIFVEIASFDYDLPEKGCIQLTADVSISGMKSEKQELEVDTDDRELEQEEEAEEAEETAFSFTAYKESEGEEPTDESDEQQTAPANEENPQVNREQVLDISAAFEKALENKHETSLPSEPVLPRSTENELDVEQEIEESGETTEEVATEDVEEEDRYEESQQQEEALAADEQELEEALEEPDQKGEREENATYLTSMLRNEVEQFTKWKMCIIQENETLDTIAERYELSASQLTRYNNLADEQVSEGQILYIPVKAK